MTTRKIKRIAFLQDYTNRPQRLTQYIPEVAAKGYHAIALAARIGQEPLIADLARQAREHGLEVMAFTGYMKYDEAYLKDHRDQRLVSNADLTASDQDHLKVFWGCPFNPSFKERYFAFLERLGAIPNMSEVWINDEACLGFSATQLGCYCPVCRAAWESQFGGPMPTPPFADTRDKARFIRWRFSRWNEVHGEMKRVLNRHHAVRAVFLTSPACTLDFNPWVSGVDLAGMMEHIDGVMTDPYYTYHLAWGMGPYQPAEVYLTENCRFLAGLAGERKVAEICAQGFSHPIFTRPMEERDGWWAGVLPLALGIDAVTAYTYTLQKVSPMQKPYEASFRLDPFFAKVRPMEAVAVIDSLETQSFHLDADQGEASWHHGSMLKVGEVLRDHGLSYVYLPSRKLTRENLNRWPAIALPEVTCLSTEAKKCLADYVRAGGVLMAFGQTATRDENGDLVRDEFLRDLFGIVKMEPGPAMRDVVEATDETWAFADVERHDEITLGYMDGAVRPVIRLNRAVHVETDPACRVLARFADRTGPAITIRLAAKGFALFVSGLPCRAVPFHEVQVLNQIGSVVARVLRNQIEDRLPMRVSGFPPKVPIGELRPLDHRRIPTVEFLPSVGEDLYLATVASYFREPMTFSLHVTIPPGRTLREVRELVADQKIETAVPVDGRLEVPVDLGFDDFLKVFGFFFE